MNKNNKLILIIVASVLAIVLLVIGGILIFNKSDTPDNTNNSSSENSTNFPDNKNDNTVNDKTDETKTKYSDLTLDWFKERNIEPNVYDNFNIYTGSCTEFPFIDGHGVFNLLVTTDKNGGTERINTLMYGHAVLDDGNAFYEEIKTIISEAQKELGYGDKHWDKYLLTNGQGDYLESETLTDEMISKLDSDLSYAIEFTSYSTPDKPTLIVNFQSGKTSSEISVCVHYPYNG